MENSYQLEWTPGEFCSRVGCIVIGHGERPIKSICFSPECKAPTKQMCLKCVGMHSMHRVVPVECLDDLTAPELQADEVTNNTIKQILANVKALRVHTNQMLDTLENIIEKMRCKSLKYILDPFVLRSVEPATVSALRDAILQNVTWNSEGNMQLKRREWTELEMEI